MRPHGLVRLICRLRSRKRLQLKYNLRLAWTPRKFYVCQLKLEMVSESYWKLLSNGYLHQAVRQKLHYEPFFSIHCESPFFSLRKQHLSTSCFWISKSYDKYRGVISLVSLQDGVLRKGNLRSPDFFVTQVNKNSRRQGYVVLHPQEIRDHGTRSHAPRRSPNGQLEPGPSRLHRM